VKALLEELLAARRSGSPERVAALLGEDVDYWDCVHGSCSGPESAAEALVDVGTALELETLAVTGGDGVIELQVDGRFRSTEVYRVGGGRVRSIKAYFVP
jgi:hypothetical protein